MAVKRKNFNFEEGRQKLFTPGRVAAILAGAAILSFGIYNIHQRTDITEGGVLGMILLLNHWFGISPAVTTPVLDVLCYAFAFRHLGKNFLKVSLISTLSFAGFFHLWEQFPPLLPDLSSYSLAAAILGGVLVGSGVGLVVRQGASCGGDDALALTISKLTGCRISRAYLVADISVLLLSLTYIPAQHIAFSLLTVTISSLLVDFMQNFSYRTKPEKETRSERRAAVSEPAKEHSHAPGNLRSDGHQKGYPTKL
ncbi:YitT family protein [Acetonema longum]|uniref:YitT family protein n=1 Tax=Acetonema longum DSM 6540 TaxID=1009370 RepID=F7NKP6_9FIRM|nr:YitT family protein [Acetonema longum]EGO63350.1 hypothetical protein ALO_13324 [Acetonema longum DSM 6540]